MSTPTRFGRGQFYGAVARRSDVAGFVLTETVYPGDTILPPHTHEYGRLELLLRGSCLETLGGRERECAPMTLTLHPPDETRGLRFDHGEARLFAVEFSPAWTLQARRDWGLSVRSAEFHGGALPMLARHLYKDFVRHDLVSSLSIESLLFGALNDSSRNEWTPVEREAPAWLGPIVQMLHARFREPLTLGELARWGGIRPETLGRVFRRVHRCSMREYVLKLRVEHACDKLRTTELPLSEIALDAGFCDQSHFSKSFKEATGVTPSVFRRSAHTGMPDHHGWPDDIDRPEPARRASEG
jgi:AraC family transcriptional regulator